MITWEFLINDVLLDDEPQGWSDLVLNITRDPEWHGIFFEAATSALGFYGDGADILRTIKRNQGLAATAKFQIRATCGLEVDVLVGTLDFGTYIEDCGALCLVNIAVEKSGCTMTLRNRYDQKVDLSSNIAFDRMTVLNSYPGLNFEMEVPAQELKIGNSSAMEEQETVDFYDFINYTDQPFTSIGHFIPGMSRLLDSSFGTYEGPFFADYSPSTAIAPPQGNISGFENFPAGTGTADLLGSIECDLSNVVVDYRMKGNITTNYVGAATQVYFSVKLYRLPAGLEPMQDPTNNWILEHEQVFFDYTTNQNIDFDISGTINLDPVTQGDFFTWGIYSYVGNSGRLDHIYFTTDVESFFKIYASSICEPTISVVSLVNETGSRIVEAITDGCMRMKSDYFATTDSQPYPGTVDGCGSLRVLTSGLRLRNAPNPKHFMSLEDYFRGLRGIDNIGMGVELDTVQGFGIEWLRVEPAEYFYQDVELLSFPAIPKAKFILDSGKGYSLVKIGYTKWEVENVNGLDEFNSNKEFRTSLETIDNTLDALSPFVAGGYPIEITRQQSFAESGGADTTYDNETFIIAVERQAYGLVVEQGNIDNASNFYSPATAYNWRLRPFYNLMRWWKSIAQSYVNLANSASKLFFASGTGNLLASGWMPGDPCELAARAIPENEDLDLPDFLVQNLPIYKPERAEFEYPFSLADYNKIKANPKGYINLQCGNGLWTKAYIINIQYKPADGMAQLNLLLRWDT